MTIRIPVCPKCGTMLVPMTVHIRMVIWVCFPCRDKSDGPTENTEPQWVEVEAK